MQKQPPLHSSGSVSRSAAERPPSSTPRTVQLAAHAVANRTGMPDHLKAGVEALSGHSLDHVRVHRNSSKPAQLNAHAYAQGSDIHLGPGQEKHLPHEAWHVVQQAQGRVRPTTQLKGHTAINDDPALEAEADTMGARAATVQRKASAITRVASRPFAGTGAGRAVVQRGAIYHLAGVSDAAEGKAQTADAEVALRHAFAKPVPVAIINSIFEHASIGALGRLPEGAEAADAIWDKVMLAHARLGAARFDHWVGRAGLNIVDVAGLDMLLSDQGARGAQQQASEVLAHVHPLPSFAGKGLDYIVGVLKARGYHQQEKFNAVGPDHDLPYGQDVWTGDDQMVVRIKVGGRSINGRFPRPPHVVKEVTKKAHAYAPADIIAKLTDENILIPAGTKYSARDMQTWYNQKAGGALPPNAWRQPEASGDADFIEIFQHWAEGAHTTIGTVPALPAAVLNGPQAKKLTAYRATLVAVNAFTTFAEQVERTTNARAQHPTIRQDLATLNRQEKPKVTAGLEVLENLVYRKKNEGFFARRAEVVTALEAWQTALVTYLSGKPPVKKNKPFYEKLFSDMKTTVATHDGGWDALKTA